MDEVFSPRIEAIGQFSVVATLVFAAALAEIGSYAHAEWPVALGRCYLVCMSITIATSFHCAMVSVLTVAVFRRMQAWEDPDMESMNKEEWMKNSDFQYVVWLFRLNVHEAFTAWHNGQSAMNVQVFGHVANHRNSSLGVGMLAFPGTCLMFVLAIAMRVLKDADMPVQIAVPSIIIVMAAPGLLMSMKLVLVLTK